jgi:hypothetical protein
MKHILTCLSLLAFFALAVPHTTHAADKPAKEKAASAIGFNGTVGAVSDKEITIKTAKTELKLVIDAESKILDNSTDKKATNIADVKEGQHVTGSYKKADDGSLKLYHLYTAPKTKEKKKAP